MAVFSCKHINEIETRTLMKKSSHYKLSIQKEQIYCLYCKGLLKIPEEWMQEYHTNCHLELQQYEVNFPDMSPEKRYWIEQLSQHSTVMTSAVGFAGIKPLEYDIFEQMKIYFTKKELQKLITHHNPVVCCYSYWALAERAPSEFFSIVLENIPSIGEEQVEYMYGCIVSSAFLLDLILEDAKHLFNTEQNISIHQLLLKHNFKIYQYYALFDARAQDNHKYSLIKNILTESQDVKLLPRLASFQKEEDIPLILKFKDENRSNFLEAVQQYPHPTFRASLEAQMEHILKVDNRYILYDFYKAVAAYQNNWAVPILSASFTKIKDIYDRNIHLEAVFTAVASNVCNEYTDLLFALWAEKQIHATMFQYLVKLDLLKSIETAYQFLVLNEMSDESLVSDIFDFLLKYDYQGVINVLKINLKQPNVHSYRIFAKKVSELQLTQFIELLFQGITQWNAHIYLAAIKSILSFNDDHYNQQIVHFRTKLKHLQKDWGGETLTELLEENHLL